MRPHRPLASLLRVLSSPGTAARPSPLEAPRLLISAVGADSGTRGAATACQVAPDANRESERAGGSARSTECATDGAAAASGAARGASYIEPSSIEASREPTSHGRRRAAERARGWTGSGAERARGWTVGRVALLLLTHTTPPPPRPFSLPIQAPNLVFFCLSRFSPLSSPPPHFPNRTSLSPLPTPPRRPPHFPPLPSPPPPPLPPPPRSSRSSDVALRRAVTGSADVVLQPEPLREWRNVKGSGENALDAFYKDPKRWGVVGGGGGWWGSERDGRNEGPPTPFRAWSSSPAPHSTSKPTTTTPLLSASASDPSLPPPRVSPLSPPPSSLTSCPPNVDASPPLSLFLPHCLVLSPSPLPPRFAYTFQSLVFISRASQYHHGLQKHPSALRLCERSLFCDRLVFAPAAVAGGLFTPLEEALYDSWVDAVLPMLPGVVSPLATPPPPLRSPPLRTIPLL
ncbi:unnamed protein product [Closterium sp. NIES-53]